MVGKTNVGGGKGYNNLTFLRVINKSVIEIDAECLKMNSYYIYTFLRDALITVMQAYTGSGGARTMAIKVNNTVYSAPATSVSGSLQFTIKNLKVKKGDVIVFGYGTSSNFNNTENFQAIVDIQ